MNLGTVAWMLRQDGQAFDVTHHFYVMDDEDLSSEAEVSAFLIKTGSKDSEYARFVLDAWMALLIENSVAYDAVKSDINDAIVSALSNLPYRFQYPLSIAELLSIHESQDNYTDVDSLYSFIDSVRDQQLKISLTVKQSVNQQFCRVRYGGQYDSRVGNNSIWFRISSVGFNWADVIYVFAAKNKTKYHIQSITICRDYESDNGDIEGAPEYIYKAKDGTYYYDMPIDEFLQEEHEHSLVFSSMSLNAGVLAKVQSQLRAGDTPYEILCALSTSGISMDSRMWKYLLKKERSRCVECVQFPEGSSTRTQNKLRKVIRWILSYYPEITDISLESEPYPNSKGNLRGIEYKYTLESDTPELNGLTVGTAFTDSTISADIMFRVFRREYEDYINNRGIRLK